MSPQNQRQLKWRILVEVSHRLAKATSLTVPFLQVKNSLLTRL